MTDSTQRRHRRRPFRWTWRIVVALIALYGLLGVLRVGWGIWASRELDLAMEQARQVDPAMERDDLLPDPEVDGSLAVVWYLRIDHRLTDVLPGEGNPSGDPLMRWFDQALTDGSLPEAASQWIASNEYLLTSLDAASQSLPGGWFDLEHKAIPRGHDGLNELRRVARFQFLAALYAAENGQSDAALVRIDQMLHLARCVETGREWMSVITGIAIRAYAVEVVALTAGRLQIGPGPGQADPQRIRGLIAALADTRAMIAANRQASVLERAHAVAASRTDPPEPVARVLPHHDLLRLVFTPLWMLNQAKAIRAHSAFIQAAEVDHFDQLPLAFRTAEPPEVAIAHRDLRSMVDAYATYLGPPSPRVFELSFRVQARQRLAAVRLAWALYAQARGAPPNLEALADLLPPGALNDPMDSKAKLRILTEGDEVILAASTVDSVQQARKAVRAGEQAVALWVDPSRRPAATD